MKNAIDYIEKSEKRTGKRIEPRRLRLYIVSELQRAYDESSSLRGNIDAVLNGHKVYDPSRQKAIALSR